MYHISFKAWTKDYEYFIFCFISRFACLDCALVGKVCYKDKPIHVRGRNTFSTSFWTEIIRYRNHRIIECIWLEGALETTSSPAIGKDIFHYTSLLKAPSNPALTISRESPAVLGNLFQGLTTLTDMNFSLISNLILLFCFKVIIPCSLTIWPCEKLSYGPPLGTGMLLWGHPGAFSVPGWTTELSQP